MKASLKVAIIGSGASAVGVLHGIKAAGVNAEITVFSDEKYLGFSVKDRVFTKNIEKFYDALYREIRSRAVAYPPRKTFYGDAVPCYQLRGNERFFISAMFGGQTNIWGGSVLPLPEHEFTSWPIDRADLEPHYRAVAELVGVAGQPDQLSDFLRLRISNCRPIKQLEGFKALKDHVNAHRGTEDYAFHAGTPHVAVDTRKDSPTSCIYCGECMAGCVRDSVYSSRSEFLACFERKSIRFVGKRIREVRIRNHRRVLYAEDGSSESFDKVFLAAGCISTTEILMRSLNLEEGPTLQDNVIYQYPVINLTRHSDKEKDKYFGLTNLIVIAEPRRPGLPFVQVQFYPNADYLWRTMVPPWLWKTLRHPVRWSRDRVMWARAYMDEADSYHYSLRLTKQGIDLEEKRVPRRDAFMPFLESKREMLQASRFVIPPVRPVLAHTSAHLAGTFPYGGELVDIARDSGVMPLPHVYISDSTCFPKSPVISPTLTIMANARRTAFEAFQG